MSTKQEKKDAVKALLSVIDESACKVIDDGAEGNCPFSLIIGLTKAARITFDAEQVLKQLHEILEQAEVKPGNASQASATDLSQRRKNTNH